MASLAAEAFCDRLRELYGVELEPTDAGQMDFALAAAGWLRDANDATSEPRNLNDAPVTMRADDAAIRWREHAWAMAESDDERLAGVARVAEALFGLVTALPGELRDDDRGRSASVAPDESDNVGRAAADCLRAWAGDDEPMMLKAARAALAG